MEDWVRVLQNVVQRNALKLLLSQEDHKPSVQGWVIKVKHGHQKKCWCVLIGKMFIYFKTPNDQVSYRNDIILLAKMVQFRFRVDITLSQFYWELFELKLEK